jgi:hypothetical protein
MLKTLLTIGSFAGVLCLSSMGHAQAMPTATAHGNLQAGGGLSLGMPDYGERNIGGATAFADFDFTPHIGVEADIHYVALVTPSDLAENSYEIGPRYVYRRGRFAPYGKVLIGLGSLVIQESQDNPGKYDGTYFMYSFGGGLDIQVSKHIIVRAIDAEVQRWPGLGNGLTPYVFTVGAAYRFR